jgi:hypothetical protein
MQKNAIEVTDQEGKTHIVMISNIKRVEAGTEGTPGVAAQPAKKAVEAQPGVPARAADTTKGVLFHPGTPPVEGTEATEAVEAVPAVSETCFLHLSDGEKLEVRGSPRYMLGMFNT